MSSASTVEGVLKACVRRVSRRWTKGAWKAIRPDDVKNDGFGQKMYCLEGGCTGGDRTPKNDLQRQAIRLLEEAVYERTGRRSVPGFNDSANTTHADVIDVAKSALAKAKARGL